MKDRLGSRWARFGGLGASALVVGLVVATTAFGGGARSTACGNVT